eukprot:SAG31_NODE_7426_length_1691_cov_1.472990_2_plen_97_part_00
MPSATRTSKLDAQGAAKLTALDSAIRCAAAAAAAAASPRLLEPPNPKPVFDRSPHPTPCRSRSSMVKAKIDVRRGVFDAVLSDLLAGALRPRRPRL